MGVDSFIEQQTFKVSIETTVFRAKMVSLRLFVAIFAFVAVAVAIKCYNQTTSDNAQPKRNVKCNSGSKYCIKVKVEQELLFLNMYGCDTGSCHADGCNVLGTKDNRTTICCCSKDLCNSSSRFSLLSLYSFTVFPMIFMICFLF
ncbi:hypothetical protein KIN20_025001 [Parelaphostrongylus tenuis]|uniref:Uncharacterized protein n=1 Tax=Parelaphostrongylus tenuis TaxID=148309 RepID=A0AAD5QX30_PARTN|nr:hypothetical protein KIN20_025001 [Parelaphostrongylus tenuis]